MDSEHYMRGPELVLDAAKTRAFEAFYDAQVAPGDGREVDYTLPYPKWEFLSWLTAQHEIVLHGSNVMDIEEFKLERRGFDANPHGNHRAIYATNDGIWPMFFAVLDKTTYKGSMRNGVMWVDADGNELDFDAARVPEGAYKVYKFSLNANEIGRKPWREAMLYILPRQTFEQLRDRDGILIAEWASRVQVKPLAKLRLSPKDFPFVDRVTGHDDSEVLRTAELAHQLVTQAHTFEELNDGFAFRYPFSDERMAQAQEYGEVLRRFIDAARVQVERDADGMCIRIQGPEALKDSLARRLAQKHDFRSTAVQE